MALGAGPVAQLVIQARGLDAKRAVDLLASAFQEGFDQVFSDNTDGCDEVGTG